MAQSHERPTSISRAPPPTPTDEPVSIVQNGSVESKKARASEKMARASEGRGSWALSYSSQRSHGGDVDDEEMEDRENAQDFSDCEDEFEEGDFFDDEFDGVEEEFSDEDQPPMREGRWTPLHFYGSRDGGSDRGSGVGNDRRTTGDDEDSTTSLTRSSSGLYRKSRLSELQSQDENMDSTSGDGGQEEEGEEEEDEADDDDDDDDDDDEENIRAKELALYGRVLTQPTIRRRHNAQMQSIGLLPSGGGTAESDHQRHLQREKGPENDDTIDLTDSSGGGEGKDIAGGAASSNNVASGSCPNDGSPVAALVVDDKEDPNKVDDDEGCIRSDSRFAPEQIENMRETGLVESKFPNKASTVYFDDTVNTCPKKSKEKNHSLTFKMTSVTTKVVQATFRRGGFRVTQRSDWVGLWGFHMKRSKNKKLTYYQRVNHFPGTWALGRKDNLHNALYRMKRRYGEEEYLFHPTTFVLPRDYKDWVAYDKANNCRWIVKPKSSCRGIGIKMLKSSSDLSKKSNCLVQRYLADPLLINDVKFDMRLYVAITSFDPLRIYLFEDGLVRFATEKYNPKKKNSVSRYMHLTNYSVNRKSANFVKNENADQDDYGHKWSVKGLQRYFASKGYDWYPVWKKIEDMVIKTVISVEAKINPVVKSVVMNTKNCFEVFGFDVILDSKLKPWILEVNVSPALGIASPLDLKIKSSMVADLFNLAGFEITDKKYAKKVIASRQPRKKRLPRKPIDSLGSPDTFCDLPEDELELLKHCEDEFSRANRFQRIYPRSDSAKYNRFFESPRYFNSLLVEWVRRREAGTINLSALINPMSKSSKKSNDAKTTRSFSHRSLGPSSTKLSLPSSHRQSQTPKTARGSLTLTGSTLPPSSAIAAAATAATRPSSAPLRRPSTTRSGHSSDAFRRSDSTTKAESERKSVLSMNRSGDERQESHADGSERETVVHASSLQLQGPNAPPSTPAVEGGEEMPHEVPSETQKQISAYHSYRQVSQHQNSLHQHTPRTTASSKGGGSTVRSTRAGGGLPTGLSTPRTSRDPSHDEGSHRGGHVRKSRWNCDESDGDETVTTSASVTREEEESEGDGYVTVTRDVLATFRKRSSLVQSVEDMLMSWLDQVDQCFGGDQKMQIQAVYTSSDECGDAPPSPARHKRPSASDNHPLHRASEGEGGSSNKAQVNNSSSGGNIRLVQQQQQQQNGTGDKCDSPKSCTTKSPLALRRRLSRGSVNGEPHSMTPTVKRPTPTRLREAADGSVSGVSSSSSVGAASGSMGRSHLLRSLRSPQETHSNPSPLRTPSLPGAQDDASNEEAPKRMGLGGKWPSKVVTQRLNAGRPLAGTDDNTGHDEIERGGSRRRHRSLGPVSRNQRASITAAPTARAATARNVGISCLGIGNRPSSAGRGRNGLEATGSSLASTLNLLPGSHMYSQSAAPIKPKGGQFVPVSEQKIAAVGNTNVSRNPPYHSPKTPMRVVNPGIIRSRPSSARSGR